MKDYKFTEDPILLLIGSLFFFWIIPVMSTFDQNWYASPTLLAGGALVFSFVKANKSGDGLRTKDYILIFLSGLMTAVSAARWLGLI